MNIFSDIQGLFIGYIIYKKETGLGPRIQQDLQLVYVYEGSAKVTVNGSAYQLGPNQATLLLPGQEEQFTFAARGTTRHGWCNVLQPRLDAASSRQLARLATRYPFTERMKNLAKMARPLRGHEAAGMRALCDTLIQALFLEFLQQTGLMDDPHPPLHQAVEQGRRFIQERYRESLDLPVISEQAGVTPAHLIRLFKEHLKVTPKHYLWQVRTEAAAHLLRNTGLSAAEVAYETGFANPHHFSRTFKQHYGLAPRAWRLQEWAHRDRPPA